MHRLRNLSHAIVQRPRGLLFAAALIGAARIAWFHAIVEARRAERDPHRIGAAFEPVRPFVRHREQIGFLSDEPIDVRPPIRHERGDELHGEAQFALAGTVLAVGAADDLVLLVLDDPAHLEDLLRKEHVRVVRSFTPAIHLVTRR